MKLLPTEVSKGVGIGVVITVTEAAVDVETPGMRLGALVAVLISEAVSIEAVFSGVGEGEEVMMGVEESEDVEDEVAGNVVGTTLSPTCLLSK